MTGQVASTELQPGCGGNTVTLLKRAIPLPLGPMVVEAGALAPNDREDLGSVFIAAAMTPWFMLLLDSVKVSGKVIVWVERDSGWFQDNLEISYQWSLASSWEDFWAQVKGCNGPRTILGQASRSKCSTYEDRFFSELKNISLGEEDSVMLISCLRRVRHLLPKLDNHHFAISNLKHSAHGGITTNSFQAIMSSRLLESKTPIPKSSITRTLGSVVKVDVGGAEVPAPPASTSKVSFPFFESECQLPSASLTSWFRVKSVFAKSGWVVRKLLPIEIASCCNVPPAMAKSFQEAVDLEHAQPADVVDLPPLKVVHAVFASAFAPNVMSAVLVPSMESPVQGRLTLSSFQEQGLIRAAVASNHAKAVKSDDAQTDTSLWDREVSPEFKEDRHG